jgi:hypothetical protein
MARTSVEREGRSAALRDRQLRRVRDHAHGRDDVTPRPFKTLLPVVRRRRLGGFDRDDVSGRSRGHLFAAMRAVELVVDRIPGNAMQTFALQNDRTMTAGAFDGERREFRNVWHQIIIWKGPMSRRSCKL